MVERILESYPRTQESLVMVLQDVQAEFGYLPKEALDEVATALDVPRAQVYSVASFYDVLSLEPRGKHLLRVCMGTACHVRQAPLLLDAAARDLDVEDGGTTEDKAFTLQSVGCVGACAIGPVVEIDGIHAGHMTVAKLSRRIERMKKKEQS